MKSHRNGVLAKMAPKVRHAKTEPHTLLSKAASDAKLNRKERRALQAQKRIER